MLGAALSLVTHPARRHVAHAVSRTDLADRLHVAAGLGMRSNVPFGPLSLDVGMGETGARRLDISFGQEF